MRLPLNKRFIFPLAFLFLCCAGILRAATVTIDAASRRLLVNGQPFVIKGVCYSPVPVGESAEENYSWWIHPQIYGTDLPLIRQLGANTVRVYSGVSVTQPFLDAAASNGLYVIMEYWVDPAKVSSSPSELLDEFAGMVTTWKDHPAVLMWSFGNEVDSAAGVTKSAWYNLLDQAAQRAHAIDPHHPVTTSNQEVSEIGDAATGSDDGSLAHLDVWGINVYRGKTFGAGFFDTVSAATAKPFYVSEWGCDVYNGTLGRVDEAMQDAAIRQQWSEIAANLATNAGGKGCNGGAVFEWCDEWWKSKLPASTKSAHDSGTDWVAFGGYDDLNINEEWWGICSISAGSYVRGRRLAYSSLQELWGGSDDEDVATGSVSLFREDVRNYPNPFVAGRGSTRIKFAVNGLPSVSAVIYDLRGREIKTITDITILPDGQRAVDWDGRNNNSDPVDVGLYIARIRLRSDAAEETKYRKIVVVK